MTDLLAHVDIAPALPSHAPWVLATFREQVSRLPLTTRAQACQQTQAIERIWRGRLGKVAVASPSGFPDELMGWALALDGALLFAYVSREFRQQGLGAALIAAVTQGAPVPVAYWTPEAEAIAAHGFPIVYSIHAFRALCRYVRRDYHQPQAERAA